MYRFETSSLSVSWCFAWAVSALYLSVDREVPALWKPCSAKQLCKKSLGTRAQAPARSLITWNNPGASCRTNTTTLASSGADGTAVRKPLLAQSAMVLCCLVVNEKGTVLSILLIRAVYQIQLSPASIFGPAHYECPASTILVKILYAAVDS